MATAVLSLVLQLATSSQLGSSRCRRDWVPAEGRSARRGPSL